MSPSLCFSSETEERDVRAENAREDTLGVAPDRAFRGLTVRRHHQGQHARALRSARARGLASPQVGRGVPSRPCSVVLAPAARRRRRRARARRVGVRVPDADPLERRRRRRRRLPVSAAPTPGWWWCGWFGFRSRALEEDVAGALGVHEVGLQARPPGRGCLQRPRGCKAAAAPALPPRTTRATSRARARGVPGGRGARAQLRRSPSFVSAAIDFSIRRLTKPRRGVDLACLERRQRSFCLGRRRAATRPVGVGGRRSRRSRTAVSSRAPRRCACARAARWCD